MHKLICAILFLYSFLDYIVFYDVIRVCSIVLRVRNKGDDDDIYTVDFVNNVIPSGRECQQIIVVAGRIV